MTVEIGPAARVVRRRLETKVAAQIEAPGVVVEARAGLYPRPGYGSLFEADDSVLARLHGAIASIAASLPVGWVNRACLGHNARRARSGAGVVGSTGPKYPYDGCDDRHGSLCRRALEHFRTWGASKA